MCVSKIPMAATDGSREANGVGETEAEGEADAEGEVLGI